MNESRYSIPQLSLQPPAVDFIDNCLPSHHPTFQDPPAMYDVSRQRFTPKTHITTASAMELQFTISPRPLASSLDSMAFWDEVFPPAMARLKAQHLEPKKRAESGYSIRDRWKWDDVQALLDNAREAYTNETGISGCIKRVRRHVADNIQPAAQLATLVPNTELVSPVVNTIQFLLEAMQRAATVREQVLNGMEDLEQIFQDVDFFLATFPKDENIRNAAVNVVTAVLLAVEQVIGFYIKHTLKKMGCAVLKGEEYQSSIIESLAGVKDSSRALIHQAQSSSIDSTRRGINEVIKRTQEMRRFQHEILRGQGQQSKDLHRIDDKVLEIRDDGRETQNYVVVMTQALNQLFELLQTYDRDRRFLVNSMKQTQEERDIERRNNASLQLDVRHVQSSTPSPSPSMNANTPATQEYHITPQQLYNLVDIAIVQSEDLQQIERRRASLPTKDVALAEQIIQTQPFTIWLRKPVSTRLLVHGNSQGIQYVSPLTLLCSTLSQTLQQKQNFVSLIFFCGLHIDQGDPNTGGSAIIRSFIAQLLSQHFIDTQHIHHEVNLNAAHAGDINALCALFVALLRRLPAMTTVFCFIDGIGYYERDQFVDSSIHVLHYITWCIKDAGIRAALKVLVTSAAPTSEVRKIIEEDEIVSMTGLRSTGGVASTERLVRCVS
ncbi:hypothetical protein CC80DRAFT_536340 [Byssothecium circinans]|uniref:Nephrocystin 3-like N-terminal domain-containing protein n=1 Tax=Byssothecium circinans TaxID=147558 RepID=A0A6A5TR40_9PLEO|nr:hypothetical protein CC80DRAFT_536340 [Byssothecium circinans]